MEDGVKVVVNNNATIGPNEEIILPGATLDVPPLTEDDEDDLIDFAIKRGADMISCPLVRKPEDIEEIRDVLGPRGAHMKLFAKIMCTEALRNFK